MLHKKMIIVTKAPPCGTISSTMHTVGDDDPLKSVGKALRCDERYIYLCVVTFHARRPSHPQVYPEDENKPL